MAEVNSIIDALGAGVKAAGPIDVWADAVYGRPVAVFENCDLRSAPGEADCPLVILYPLAKISGLGHAEKRVSIGVSCWVYDPGQPESVEGVQRFEGGRNVETLRMLVLSEIVDHLPAGVNVDTVDTQYNTIAEFPLVEANMEIKLTEIWTSGSSAYE